jgi:hypothetical protein
VKSNRPDVISHMLAHSPAKMVFSA